MLKIKNAEFIKSTLDWRESPQPPLPEIAFVGRSNVGKSSLINSLVNIKNFARVSKQPGKTQTINFFSIDQKFYLVDLPGYGFAKTSKRLKANWQKAIEEYLLNSVSLNCLMVLIDSKVGPKQNDVLLVEWLEYKDIPYQIVATKVDKVSKNYRLRQTNLIARELNQKSNQILVVSAKDNTGQKDLLGAMGKYLGKDEC